MKPLGFHDGDRSEYLAAFAFDTIGYTVPVPRQEDRFLVDYFVHLAKRDSKKRFVPKGVVICVQVKSDKSQIDIIPEHVIWLNQFMSPVYVSVVDKVQHSLEIFHTMGRLEVIHQQLGNALAFYWEGEPPKTITFGEQAFTCDPIRLGKPIIQINLQDLDHEESSKKWELRDRFFNIMQAWAILEHTALTWKHMNLLFRPVVDYETNKIPSFDDFEYATYGSPNDIAPAAYGLGVLLYAFNHMLDAASVNVQSNKKHAIEDAITTTKQFLEYLRTWISSLH